MAVVNVKFDDIDRAASGPELALLIRPASQSRLSVPQQLVAATAGRLYASMRNSCTDTDVGH